VDELDQRIERLEKLAKEGSRVNSSASNITVNAGGIGVWICCTFCALCLMASLFTLWIVTDIRQNDRDQGNQLNAIYMMAPHLKPEKTK